MQINQNLYRIYRRLHADDFFCVFFMNILLMSFTNYITNPFMNYTLSIN